MVRSSTSGCQQLNHRIAEMYGSDFIQNELRIQQRDELETEWLRYFLQVIPTVEEECKTSQSRAKPQRRQERTENDIRGIVVGAAIAVHKGLGPGSFETFYEVVLAYELEKRGVEEET